MSRRDWMKPGLRVGAILGAREGRVEFFGYGVYEGDFEPEGAVGGVAEITKIAGWKNPRIRLDSGKVVWGCESWWGPEDQIRERLAKYDSVVEVDIDDIRARWTTEDSPPEQHTHTPTTPEPPINKK